MLHRGLIQPAEAIVGFGGLTAAAYTAANGADFDGTNDYMSRGAGLTGAADGKLFSGSIWFKRGGTAAIMNFTRDDGGFVFVRFDSDDKINITGHTSGASKILEVRTSALTDTASWHHVLWSFDMADSGNRHLYLDDTSDLTAASYTDGSIDFTRSDWGLGATPTGTQKMNACLQEVYINMAENFDFSVESNRRKFIDASSKPVDLGTDGSTPSGTAPIIYLKSAFGSFETNDGGGGDFSVTGSLADCGSSPSD